MKYFNSLIFFQYIKILFAMLILLLFSFGISSPSSQSITVCLNSCPDGTPGHLIIASQAGDDISSQVDKYLGGTKTQIYFYNESDFVFQLNLKIFQGHTVEFLRLDDSKPVDIEIDCTDSNGKSTGSFTFRKIYVDFSSLIKLSNLEVDGFTIEDSIIDLFNIEGSLIAGSVTADSSISKFSTISIKTSYSSSTGATLNIDSKSSITVSAFDFGAEVALTKKTISFTYDQSLSSKRLDIVNTDLSDTSCNIEYHCSDVSKLIQLSFTDIRTLYYLNSWPSSAITNVIIDDMVSISICANSTVLPISFTCDKSIPAIIVITQETTTITGDISGSVIFSNPADKFLVRKSIAIEGSFSGSLLDLGSSYFDVTISNFVSDISSYGNFPFAFRVGTGGASTLRVYKSSSATTKRNGITVYPDFEKYLADENLQKLLSNNWTILTLDGVSLSVSFVNIEMQNTPFIHGFIKDDSCISVRVESNTMILSASPPSLLPLNICYDGDKEGGECSDEDGIEVDSIDLITNYFEDGMKYLNLSIKAFHVNTLDLTSLDYGYSGVRIILKGGSNTVLNTIYTKEGLGVDYLEINNIILGSSCTFYIKEMVFNEVKTDGHPTFTFKSSELVVGDDSFIQNISPGISPSSKIPKISYRMDKYDSITITDDKFIFYDIAMNDLSDPAELDFDVVDFLDIIYDVGITQTAEDNSLNVTMQTKNPPSFNITFSSLYSTGIWEVPELIIYSWSQTQSSNFKTYFMHEKLDVKIILTEPYKPSQLIPIGTGIVTYENRYTNSLYYCSTLDADKESCPSHTEFVPYDQLNTKLQGCDGDNITIYIKSTSSNYPSVDIFNINKKITYFIGLDSSSSTPTNYVEISSSKDVDLTITTTIFKDICIKTTSQTTKIIFGEVQLNNAVIDSSFKNVEVTIDDFYCEYKYLSCFKTVTIADNLIVNGELATEESTVNFIPDKNANDLNATISSDATLIMGDKSIKIGKTKFQFGSDEPVYDIVLYFESSSQNIQINKDDSVSESNIPNVQIRKTSGATFTFSNNWKGATRVQPHIFLFSDLSNSKFYLTGPNTPVSFSADGELSIISKAEATGITGYFDFHDMSKSSTINVLYEGVSKSIITVSQYISVANNIVIKFSQPNIEFNIDNVMGYSRDTAKIQPELFSNLDGDSLLVIKDPMNNVIISSDYRAQVPIKEDISNQKVIDYYSKNHTLIKVSTSDTGMSVVRSFTLIGTQPTTHGFLENNMNMKVDELTGEISMYFKKNPLIIPYNLCYKFDEGTASCEITLTEDNIDNFGDLLPSGSLTIQARFGEENTKFFNLNIPKIKGSTVFISQQTQAQLAVRMNLGTNIISLLSLNQVSGRIMDSSTFKCDRVEISNGAEIDQVNGFSLINIDFDTIWKIQVFPECNNDIVLNLTASSLTFTNNGWNVNGDNEILQSSYPNIKFHLDSYITTKLEATKGLTEIKDTTIYTTTKKFILGSNWQSVTSSTNKVNIVFENEDSNNIAVTTSSYPFIPFPQLMSAETIQFDPSVLPYEVPINITLENVKSEIDFSNVIDNDDEEDKAQITFKGITFKGLSSLSAKGFSKNAKNDDFIVNPIKIENLEIVDGSTTTLNNALINKFLGVYGESSIYGDFDVSVDLDILMKWKLYKMPKILIKTIPEKVPQLITFSFDDVSIDGKENEYENYLYHHTFELIRINKLTRCETWKSILVFNSPNVTLFGSESIFDASCDDTRLTLFGARHISESNGGKKLSSGAIVAIVFTVIIVVGAICFGLYVYLKKRKSSYQQLNTDVLDSRDLNQDQYTK